MIIKCIDKRYRDECALIVGIFLGVSIGLVGGLIAIIEYSFIESLISGLFRGLVVFGALIMVITGFDFKQIDILLYVFGFLITFISLFGLTSLIMHFPSFIHIGLFIVIGIIIAELFFWLDKQKPKKKQNKFWFTTLKKGEAILEAAVVLGVLNLVRLGIKEILKLKINWEVVITWIGYIGIGLLGLALVIGILWLYIKLNSLKYKKRKCQ